MEIYKIDEHYKKMSDLRATVKISNFRLEDGVLISSLGTHEIEQTSFGYSLSQAGKIKYQLIYRTSEEPLKKSKKENLL